MKRSHSMVLVRTVPRKVNFDTQSSDIRCACLGLQGFSTRMISADTGLSNYQVTYRLSKAQVRRADYRNGTSPFAEAVITSLDKESKKFLIEHLDELRERQAKEKFRAAKS